MSSYTGGRIRIGELARRGGLAATALRYYEKAGLLPEAARTTSGYRSYSPDVLARLAFIRAAQAVGLTVAEIREVIGIRAVGAAPCAHVLQLIERRRAEVSARIHELQQLVQELMRLAEEAAALNPCGFALLPTYLGLYLGTTAALRPADPSRQSRLLGRSLVVSASMTVSFVGLFGGVGVVLSVASAALSPALPWISLSVGIMLVVTAGFMLGGGSLAATGPERVAFVSIEGPRVTGEALVVPTSFDFRPDCVAFCAEPVDRYLQLPGFVHLN